MNRSSKSKRHFPLFAVTAFALVAAGCAPKSETPLPGAHSGDAPAEAAHAGSTPAAGGAVSPGQVDASALAIAKQKPTYPLATCVVCDAAIDSKGTPKDVLRDGRLVRLCCDECVASFDANASPSFAKIDAGVVAAQASTYPLDVCVVSGEKLGSMGEAELEVVGTRLVELCCSKCESKLESDPAAALAKVDAAYADAQRASYPVTKCPLMNQAELGSMGEPVEILYGTRLVRLCCEVCVEEFWKRPEATIAALDAMTPAPAGS